MITSCTNATQWCESTLYNDHGPIHHADEVLQIIKNAGAKVIYLSLYSPDLNPLEPVFLAKLKAILKENSNIFKRVPPRRHFLQWDLE